MLAAGFAIGTSLTSSKTPGDAQDDDGFFAELAEHYCREWDAIVADPELWPAIRGRLVRSMLNADPPPSAELAEALRELLGDE